MSTTRVVRPVSSTDDLRISPSPSPSPMSGRLRSMSPEKRRITSPLSYKYDDNNDIRSLVSSPNLTPTHLRQLSKSPVSKKLHVTSVRENSKYIIPVPFQLTLPPKLSRSPPKRITNNNNNKNNPYGVNNGTRTSSGTLIFTPNGYTKLDTLSEDEVEEEDLIDMDEMTLGSKNSSLTDKLINLQDSTQTIQPNSKPIPSTVTDDQEFEIKLSLPRRPISLPTPINMNKFQIPNRFKDLDELSIIEEVSNTGSRLSSVLSKHNSLPKKFVKSLPPTPAMSIKDGENPFIDNKPKDMESSFTIKQKESLPKLPNSPAFSTTRPKSLFISPEQSIEISKNVKRTLSDKSLVSSIGSFSTIGEFITTRMETSSPTLSALSPGKPNKLAATTPEKPKVENSIVIPKSPSRKPPLVNQVYNRGKVLKLAPAPIEEEFIQQSKKQQESQRKGIPRSPNAKNLAILPELETHLISKKTTHATLNSSKSTVEDKSTILLTKPPNPFVTNNTRNISESSTGSCDSATSTESYNSIQESIDIRVGDLSRRRPKSAPQLNFNPHSNKLRQLFHAVEQEIMSQDDDNDDDDWEDVMSNKSSSQESLIQPLHISRKSTTTIFIQHDSQANDDEDEEVNQGSGKNFQFPNNNSNITNSQITKLKPDTEHKKRYSFYSSTGQIEIPDLNDQRVLDEYSQGTPSSYNGTTFSDIRSVSTHSDTGTNGSGDGKELNVPGKEAVRHFNRQFGILGLDNEDDESESDMGFGMRLKELYGKKNSLEQQRTNNEVNNSSVQAKNTEEADKKEAQLPFGDFKSIPPTYIQSKNTLRRGSPVKHTRHRSMYNIDFNPETSIRTPSDTHTRSKSLGETLKEPTAPLNIKPKHHSPSPSRKEAKPVEGEIMNISVAPPPSKVNYAVDFQESKTVDCDGDLPGLAMHDKLILNMIKEIQNRQIKEKTTKKADEEDTENVVIDLTKDEKIDLCFVVNRKDSILSYKSVTEKLKDGKEVEVVIVDDVDDDDNDNTIKQYDTETEPELDDDILSIISKYKTNWGTSRQPSTTSSCTTLGSNPEIAEVTKLNYKLPYNVQLKELSTMPTSSRVLHELAKKRTGGGGSISSLSSSAGGSSVTYVSNRIRIPRSPMKTSEPKYVVATPEKMNVIQKAVPEMKPLQETQESVESKDKSQESTMAKELNIEKPRNTTATLSRTRSASESSKLTLKEEKRNTIPSHTYDSNYFDYRTSENYDFNTFMQQRISTGP